MIQGMCKSCCARHSGSTVNITVYVLLNYPVLTLRLMDTVTLKLFNTCQIYSLVKYISILYKF